MEDLSNLFLSYDDKGLQVRMESRCNSTLVWRIHTRCFMLADRGEDGFPEVDLRDLGTDDHHTSDTETNSQPYGEDYRDAK